MVEEITSEQSVYQPEDPWEVRERLLLRQAEDPWPEDLWEVRSLGTGVYRPVGGERTASCALV